jgi:hypothetical protein
MYEVDEKDRVRELADVPQSSVGAPNPFILGDERRVVLAYYLQETPSGWDGSTVRIVSPDYGDEPIAIVRFALCHAHMFGPPDDEAFTGHPLASRGLSPYGAFEVEHSSWIRRLERMNSVHPAHRAERFWKMRHLIFTFHDSTFECVCDAFDITRARGSIASVVPDMMTLLGWTVG